jgi:type IV pilus assembly protein PilM
MISLFGNKKVHAFGLDISDLSIKVMQLRRREKSLIPSVFTDYPLSSKIISNHLIVSEDKLAENIGYALDKAGKMDTSYVVASLPEAKSFVRQIQIAKLPESEIEGAIPWELEQDIPVPIDQVYLDWQIVSEASDKLNILVAATPKDYVESIIDTLKMAKLKPVALELESQATARCLVGPDDAKGAVLVLDIATMQTSFVIVEEGILEYTSSIPVAGNAFTESIARNLGVPAAEAEKLKRELGLLAETKRGNIRQSILPILDNIVDEIKNVVRFHEEHETKHKAISKVILSGGSSRLLGMADYISARLNLGASQPLGRVVLGNPWVNLNISNLDSEVPMTREQALSYATAIGLALRGLG